MCMGGGGGSSGPAYNLVQYTDPTSGKTSTYWVEQGVPAAYAARGATTVAQYQTMASQDISNQQIAAQQSIANQQQQFNEQQLQYQQQQAQQEQDQANQQAQLQSEYTTDRQNLLTQGAGQINQAFSQFTPDYFNQYAQDYMSQAQSDGGLGLGTTVTSVVFLLAILGLVIYLTMTKRDQILPEKAEDSSSK